MRTNIPRLARYTLWLQHPHLFEAVLSVLSGYDPIGICLEANPEKETEYAPEANALLERWSEIRSLPETRRVLGEEFTRWFGIRTEAVAVYDYISADIWRIAQER